MPRELSDAEKKKREWMYQNLKKGMVVKGKVKSIQPYGIFIDIGSNITGLLHVSDISVVRIEHPAERFKLKQNVEVMVKRFDKNTGRLTLTYKELLGTWEDNIQKIKEKTTAMGIVRNRDRGRNIRRTYTKFGRYGGA